MIELIQKEYDLLVEVANYVPTEDKPFKVVSMNNGSVPMLVQLGLVNTRPKEGNGLMQEIVILELGRNVVNNEVEHNIVQTRTIATDTSVTTATQQGFAGANGQTDKVAPLTDTFTTSNDNGEYAIDYGIPIPQTVYSRNRKSKLPIDKLEVNASFLVPFKEGEDLERGRKRILGNVSMLRKKIFGVNSGHKFVVATMPDGYRVWRTA